MSSPDLRTSTTIWLHASCVQCAGRGVLLLGRSGAGKSDLALRLIDDGARLVADDQVEIRRAADRLLARPAAVLAGLIEVRGLGIVRLPHCAEAAIELVVDLQPGQPMRRLPPDERHELLGLERPLLRLDPRAPSSVIKIKWALDVDRVA
jgi:serine kinase of HPr protein (carbohydrate metabolism regulator)